MFTAIDKALVAFFMAILYFLNTFGGIEIPFLAEGSVNAIVAFLTPFLVWLIPNRTA